MEERVVIEGLHYSNQVPVRVVARDGLISDIIEIDTPLKNFIAPGFIDNQVNGYMGVDFSGDDLDHDRIEKITSALWREGVTSYLPTLITNSRENLVKNFRILSTIPTDSYAADSIIGYHLEGPYLSPEPGFFGCHPLSHIRNPDWNEFLLFNDAAGEKIKQVTLAPELDGALEFIRQCADRKIVVALGHTNARAERIREAVSTGASLSTHLGNGCANLIHRHFNPLWPQLDMDNLTVTMIADGHHLPPEMMRVIFKVKGPDRLILTSDMSFPAGMKPGKYFFGGGEVELKPDGRLESVSNNCLAGASFSIRTGVENMMTVVNCSLNHAIDMASRNPAKIFQLSDRGALRVGMRADIILFDLEGTQMKINATYLKGQKVFDRETETN
jgi:N-acetylglucosamine-6-phosphate deacetylase